MGGHALDRHGRRIPVEIPRSAIGICHSDGQYSRGCITSRNAPMPAWEMTPAEIKRYGSRLNVWESIQRLQTWQPLRDYARRFVSEVDPAKQRQVVAEAAEWIASKTDAVVDARLARMVGDALATPAGMMAAREWLYTIPRGET